MKGELNCEDMDIKSTNNDVCISPNSTYNMANSITTTMDNKGLRRTKSWEYGH